MTRGWWAIPRAAALGAAMLLAGCQVGGLAGLEEPPVAALPVHAGLLAAAKDAFRAGDFPGAESAFLAALEARPDDPEALLGLAATYDRLGRFEAADGAYGRVIAAVGRRPEILNNLAASYYLRGDRARARAVLEEAARLDPDNPQLRANAALLAS